MAICIGPKACRRAQCKDRCRSWFSMYPDVERACINACKDNSSVTRDDILCSGRYIDEAAFIRAYGLDPCTGGTTMGDVLDPLNDREAQEKQFQDLAPFLWGLGGLILLALAILYFLKR